MPKKIKKVKWWKSKAFFPAEIILSVFLIMLFTTLFKNAGKVFNRSTAAPLADAYTNLIANSGFENNKNNWSFYTNKGASFNIISNGYDSASAAKIFVPYGTQNTQLYQAQISLSPNTRYRLSMDLKSDKGSHITVSLHKHNSPYSDYGLWNRKIDISNQWRNYTVEFTSKNISTMRDTRLKIVPDSFQPGNDTFYIDNILLISADSNTQPQPTNPPIFQTAPPFNTPQPPVPQPTSVSGQTVTFAGAGSIARCGSSSTCPNQRTAQLIEQINPTTVFAVGDLTYENDSVPYNRFYNPTWGRFKNKTKPTVGNHDIPSLYFNYWGSAAGPVNDGWYSYNLGNWHIVNLNTVKTDSTTIARQLNWLRSDLAANPRACLAATMHHPRYESGPHGDNPELTPYWNELLNYGSEFVISGHGHFYQRTRPLGTNRNVTSNGIVQFNVGTGGDPGADFAVNTNDSINASISTNNQGLYGVLKFTLKPGGYDFQYISLDNRFNDNGSADCSGSSSSGGNPTNRPTPAPTTPPINTPAPSSPVNNTFQIVDPVHYTDAFVNKFILKEVFSGQKRVVAAGTWWGPLDRFFDNQIWSVIRSPRIGTAVSGSSFTQQVACLLPGYSQDNQVSGLPGGFPGGQRPVNGLRPLEVRIDNPTLSNQRVGSLSSGQLNTFNTYTYNLNSLRQNSRFKPEGFAFKTWCEAEEGQAGIFGNGMPLAGQNTRGLFRDIIWVDTSAGNGTWWNAIQVANQGTPLFIDGWYEGLEYFITGPDAADVNGTRVSAHNLIGATVRGSMTIGGFMVRQHSALQGNVHHIEIRVDQNYKDYTVARILRDPNQSDLNGIGKSRQTFTFDTRQLSDGWHVLSWHAHLIDRRSGGFNGMQSAAELKIPICIENSNPDACP